MKNLFLIALAFALLLPSMSSAQSDTDTPLGDVARAARQKKAAPRKSIIDNDNLPQVMEAAESQRSRNSPSFTFDGSGRTFQVSTSPDVSCSLSFNANNAPLLTSVYVAKNLPDQELFKLDGPATIQGDSLQIMVFNGTQWNVREITIGLTLVKKPAPPDVPDAGAPKLLPALVAADPAPVPIVPEEKRSDVTVIYHLKGTAAPNASTLFSAPISIPVGPDQEWHWAVIEAKGIPPQPASLETAGN